MIKLVACIKRNPAMSREEFKKYWLEVHGPLFRKFAEIYHAVRYVQSHTVDTPLNESMKKSRGYLEEYDGVGEIWFQSEEDFKRAITSPEGQELRKMFVEDEGRFADLKASSGFFTVEHVLVDHLLIPPSCYCPITKEVMNHPVVLAETGVSYEKAAIEAWFLRSNRDPMTGKALSDQTLIFNRTLKEVIETLKRSLPEVQKKEMEEKYAQMDLKSKLDELEKRWPKEEIESGKIMPSFSSLLRVTFLGEHRKLESSDLPPYSAGSSGGPSV